jgi:hypothetical protein
MASTNKKSRGKTATANREGATAKKSLPPPSGLTRKPAASSIKASKKKAAESEEAAADGQTMPAPGQGETKRKFSLRGAAPWAARHAAKQAAEAAERLREPPRPGSARATLRTPEQADEIKARMNALHQAVARIRALRKNLATGFYEMGVLLKNISEQKLYEAKGYNSFEAFVEREIDLPKNTVLKLARVPLIFQESAALDCGLDATLAALDAFESTKRPKVSGRRTVSVLPLKPPR